MMNIQEPVPVSSPAPMPLRIETRFGVFDADRADVLSFPDGLPGFEQSRHFVVLSDDRLSPLQVLQSVDGPDATFLAIDPRLVLPSYRCVLSESDRVRLGAPEWAPVLWLVLVTLDEDGRGTANLRAPIVINPGLMLGFQVMPHNSLYPLRHPLEFADEAVVEQDA